MKINANSLIWDQSFKTAKGSFQFFQRLEFCHVSREANQAAHYLAKFALLSCTDFMWIEETLSCISAVVGFDLLPPLF